MVHITVHSTLETEVKGSIPGSGPGKVDWFFTRAVTNMIVGLK